MSTHLILTVGTGTAGTKSNLAEGLKAAVRLANPSAIWLIPSMDENSRDLMAEEVRAAFPEKYRAWSAAETYRCVHHPDDLESARTAVREVILAAKAAGASRILVNPTSGTKQMTAGATLAALDAGLAELSFIVGERADGVVITGAERLTTWSADRWLAEQSLGDARRLYDAGAYPQAEQLLARHATAASDLVARPLALCRLASAWAGLDFAGAVRHAQAFGDAARAARYATLAREAGEEQPSRAVVAEALAIAEHHRRRADHEAAIHGFYRTLELALKLRIWEITGVPAPWPIDAVFTWNIPDDLKYNLEKKAGRDGTVRAGLADTQRLAAELGDTLGAASRDGTIGARLFRAVDTRNAMSHALRKLDPAAVDAMGDLVRNLLNEHLKPPAPVGLPKWPA